MDKFQTPSKSREKLIYWNGRNVKWIQAPLNVHKVYAEKLREFCNICMRRSYTLKPKCRPVHLLWILIPQIMVNNSSAFEYLKTMGPLFLSEGKMQIVKSLVKEIKENYLQDIFNTLHQVNGKRCIFFSRAQTLLLGRDNYILKHTITITIHMVKGQHFVLTSQPSRQILTPALKSLVEISLWYSRPKLNYILYFKVPRHFRQILMVRILNVLQELNGSICLQIHIHCASNFVNVTVNRGGTFRFRKSRILHRDPSRWPRGTLYLQKLALISPTSGSRSVGIIRLRTNATELVS
jgi:hypothetical protein